MNRIVFSCFAGLLLAAGPALAQEVKPGLWQYTVSMNVPGVPAAAHTQNFERCLTPKDVQDKSAYLRSSASSPCTMSDFKRQGSQFSYTMSCKGEMSMTGKVTGTSTPDSMTLNMDMNMSQAGMGSMKQTMTGKRVGECKADSKKG